LKKKLEWDEDKIYDVIDTPGWIKDLHKTVESIIEDMKLKSLQACDD